MKEEHKCNGKSKHRYFTLGGLSFDNPEDDYKPQTWENTTWNSRDRPRRTIKQSQEDLNRKGIAWKTVGMESFIILCYEVN